MALDPLTAIGNVLTAVINKFPDGNKAAEMADHLATLQSNGQLAEIASEQGLMTAQLGINLADAQSGDRFRSYWRPALAWSCEAGFVLNYIIAPVINWFASQPVPTIPSSEFMPVLMAILGLGSMRSFDKWKGVS